MSLAASGNFSTSGQAKKNWPNLSGHDPMLTCCFSQVMEVFKGSIYGKSNITMQEIPAKKHRCDIP